MNRVDHPMVVVRVVRAKVRVPVSPWGTPAKGLSYAQQQTYRLDDCAASQQALRGKMARSIKKGPFIDAHLLKKVDAARNGQDKRPIKTWSRRSTVLGFRRAHDCGPQRPPACAGVYLREHGRS